MIHMGDACSNVRVPTSGLLGGNFFVANDQTPEMYDNLAAVSQACFSLANSGKLSG